MSAGSVLLSWLPPEGTAPRRCRFSSTCTIGRDPKSRIILDGADVSRRQASVELSPLGLSIINKSRSRSIVVNDDTSVGPGQRLPLKAGDRITIGQTTIVVEELDHTPPSVVCANQTCGRKVEAHHSDCPWCGTSLAFARTSPDVA